MINVDGLIDQTTGAQRRLIYLISSDLRAGDGTYGVNFGRCWLFLAHESQV